MVIQSNLFTPYLGINFIVPNYKMTITHLQIIVMTTY